MMIKYAILIADILRSYPDVSSIRVLDDLFLRDETSVNNAIELFSEFPNLTWRGMAHILTFTKLLHTLPTLKGSGCRELFVGIESGSTSIRRKINKPGTPDEVVNVISAILRVGIDVKGYFMYGFPTETTVEANATFELASALNQIAKDTDGRFRTSVFQFRPYHGTQLYNEILQSGRNISSVKQNDDLNDIAGRSQFNFHSGNYSEVEDGLLSDYILKTQRLSEVRHV